MAVPTSTSAYLVNTTGGAFIFAVEGGCILQNSAVTSGLGAVITKALSLKDGVSLAADSNTLPRIITGNGTYNAQKALSAGTFAYEAEGKYVIARQSTTLSGVAKTNLLFMGVGTSNQAILQFQHDYGAKIVTAFRADRFSWTHTTRTGAKMTDSRINWLDVATGGMDTATAPDTLSTTNMWDPIAGATGARTDKAANPTRAIPGELVMKVDFVDLTVATGGDFFDYSPITGM